MREALKEYNESVLKPSMKWISKHWKGYVLLCAVVYGGLLAWFYWTWYSDEIIEFFGKIKSKFVGKEEA